MGRTRICRCISKTVGLKGRALSLYEVYDFRTCLPKYDSALSGRNATHYNVPVVFIFIYTRLNGVISQNIIMFFIQFMFITGTYTLPVVPYLLICSLFEAIILA
jgi:hypothetical protein